MAWPDFVVADLYTALIAKLNAAFTGVGGLFKDQAVGDFVGQVRVSSAGKRLEVWDGAAWVAVDLSSTGIAAASIATGTITATLAGNSTSSTNATDHIADVAGAVHGATSAKTANMICRRDAAGAIAADVTGVASAIAVTALAQVYPVGSVYLSTVATSPATLFGFGTWVALGGRMLIGADGTYANGATGGAATHALTAAENGAHAHDKKVGTGGSALVWYPAMQQLQAGYGFNQTESSGSGNPHNNMPPYLAVHMWKRTA